MWRHFRTLRFRLALLYLVVFGAILTGLCLAILTQLEADLRADFDARLRDRAEAMADKIVSIARQRAHGASAGSEERSIPFSFPRYYFQLRSADGDVVERSNNLGPVELPLSETATKARSRRSPVLETLQGEVASQLIGNPGDVRLLTMFLEHSLERGEYLQIAVNLRSVNESITSLRQLLLTMVSTGLLLAAVASWLLAGRSLAPISRVAEVAERLSVHDLSQRVDHAAGTDEVAEMVRRVNRMLDRLEEAFASQGQFITNVSHELKTPLAVLLGTTQVLLQKERKLDEHQRFAVAVQDEIRVLSQTVDSLLTLARSEAGLLSSDRQEVSLNEAVMDAVQRTEGATKDRSVRLVTQLAPLSNGEAAPLVLGDGELLRLMFTNLLRNAVRYSPEGEAVEVTVTLEDREARIAVRDHGPGIPQEHIDRVFDRFYRVPHADKGFKGVGLGLTIVRSVTVLHGGSVGVCNHEQGGCEFVVHLPLFQSNPAQLN